MERMSAETAVDSKKICGCLPCLFITKRGCAGESNTIKFCIHILVNLLEGSLEKNICD